MYKLCIDFYSFIGCVGVALEREDLMGNSGPNIRDFPLTSSSHLFVITHSHSPFVCVCVCTHTLSISVADVTRLTLTHAHVSSAQISIFYDPLFIFIIKTWGLMEKNRR